LCEARTGRWPFDGFPEGLGPADEQAAYRVQAALHDCLTRAGRGDVVGHKIGCTTPVMQAYLGIDHPCAGGVFAATVAREEGRFDWERFVRVGVECELAVELGADLPPARAPFDRAAVAAAVSSCMAAIEVVDDRYRDYRSLSTPTLIADDFFGAGCVLGRPVSGFDPARLARARAAMRINGERVGEGVGTDILGEPLDALAWLANSLAQRGDGLKRGEFVLLGSLVQTHWLRPGAEVVVENEPLGAVRATFPTLMTSD
jgi:2-oxo-3-hexenedioate decarboxylase/2-keto-4-pentenoate hydratase